MNRRVSINFIVAVLGKPITLEAKTDYSSVENWNNDCPIFFLTFRNFLWYMV